MAAGAAIETPAQTQMHVTSASPATSLGVAGAAPQTPATVASTFNTESREPVTASAAIAQKGNIVKGDLVSRLENLTAILRNQPTEAAAAQPVSVALIERLESVTETLKSQGDIMSACMGCVYIAL